MADAYPVRVDRTAGQIIESYRRGQRDFSRSDLPDASSFGGQDLSAAIFDDSWIGDADFSGATLRQASFRRAHLKCATFDSADLTGADLRGAALDAASFEGARLEGIKLLGASAYGYVYADGELPQ